MIGLISLGANLSFGQNNPSDTLQQALLDIKEAGFELLKSSPFYHTPCFPEGVGPDYVNAAAVISISPKQGSSPELALERLHEIENRHGRVRGARWTGRTLDMDLLALDAAFFPDFPAYDYWRSLPPEEHLKQTPPGLILPHPRMHERAFVLVPLADVAPEWRHPVLSLTTLEMLEMLPASQRREICRIS